MTAIRARYILMTILLLAIMSPSVWSYENNGITITISASQTADDATDAVTVYYRGSTVEEPFTHGAEQVYGVYGAGSNDYLNGQPTWRVFTELTVEIKNEKETNDDLIWFYLEVRLDLGEWYTVHGEIYTATAQTTRRVKPGAVVDFDPKWVSGGEKAEFHWKVCYDTAIAEEEDAPSVYLQSGDAPTPTVTPTPTATSTPTPTWTPTPTFTPIPPTATPTTPPVLTPTPTFTPLGGGTNTPTPTATGGPTATRTPTNTYTPVVPYTPTPGNTPTPTRTPTTIPTPTPTATAITSVPTATPGPTRTNYTDDDIYEIIWRPPSKFKSFLDIEGAARANVWGVSATLAALPTLPTTTIFNIVYRWQEGDTVRVRGNEGAVHYWYDATEEQWIPQYKYSEWRDLHGGVIRPATENSPIIFEAVEGATAKVWVDGATYPNRVVLELPDSAQNEEITWIENNAAMEPQAFAFTGRGDLEPIEIRDATGNVVYFDPDNIRVEVEGGTKTRWPNRGLIGDATFPVMTRFDVIVNTDEYGMHFVPQHTFTFPYKAHCVAWYFPKMTVVLPPLDIPEGP